jgi:urease beta subunit
MGNPANNRLNSTVVYDQHIAPDYIIDVQTCNWQNQNIRQISARQTQIASHFWNAIEKQRMLSEVRPHFIGKELSLYTANSITLTEGQVTRATLIGYRQSQSLAPRLFIERIDKATRPRTKRHSTASELRRNQITMTCSACALLAPRLTLSGLNLANRLRVGSA